MAAAAAADGPPPLHRPWQAWVGRFDERALRPPEARPGDAALQAAHTASLNLIAAWALDGAGPGTAPLWQPMRLPQVDKRMATEVMQVPDPSAAEALANLAARGLDGSLRLATLPRAAGLAWRLQVKLADAAWWRPVGPAHPWDAGWARTDPAAVQHLAQHFQPRRATLVLARADDAALLQPALAGLQSRALHLARPVRWLWVGSGAAPAPLPGVPADASGDALDGTPDPVPVMGRRSA